MRGDLARQAGVLDVTVSWLEGKAKVIYNPTAINPKGFISALPDYYRGQIVEDKPYGAEN